MMQKVLKVTGSIGKAINSKSAPDIIKAGSETIGLVGKMAKKKKKDEDKRKRARR